MLLLAAKTARERAESSAQTALSLRTGHERVWCLPPWPSQVAARSIRP